MDPMKNGNPGQDNGSFSPGEGQLPQADVTLSRHLDLFTITMIGAGIFVLTGTAAGIAGPALILVFLLNGLITLLTGIVYAELGSAFPEAGGGYLWVKEGLGGLQGFLSGWMSWFAHAVAGSLYALGFGRFAVEIWTAGGLPLFGLSRQILTLLLMTGIVLIFTYVNFRGVSETGKVGNFVTMTKIVILGVFVIFGLSAMAHNTAWHVRFTEGFLPNGMTGVLMAMGLTFIAFEGYEIIAQSGEEVQQPERNIPRAIFLAIVIAVLLYLLVGVTMIGAAVPPAGLKAHQYLGLPKETAVVEVAQQVFPWGIGGAILLFSGLVASMSALNATTFSSSRVSFAMGHDHNMPAFFARIHPKHHTPYLAVIGSGILMVSMAWLLPLEGVASAAAIMFLLLFLQVNATAFVLRRSRPDLKRTYKIPWFPALPLLAILANSTLAIFLFIYDPTAALVAVAWIVTGMLAYYAYFAHKEAMEKPKEILHEEVLVSRDYSVVIPVGDEEQARILGQIGAVIARAHQGEVIALRVVRVPPQLTLGEGRLLLKEGRPFLETAIQQAKRQNVPVHTIIRLGRSIPEAIRKTVEENTADLLLVGWPGHTSSADHSYGSVIDPLLDNSPVDIAVIRYRAYRPLKTILVPIAGGPNSRRAVQMAVNMASSSDDPVAVRLLHVVPRSAGETGWVRALQALHEVLAGIPYEAIDQQIVLNDSVVEAILEEAQNADLVIIGGSEEPLFHNLLLGSIPEQITRRAKVTVIMVKRRSRPFHDFLRRTILEPTPAPVILASVLNGVPIDAMLPRSLYMRMAKIIRSFNLSGDRKGANP